MKLKRYKGNPILSPNPQNAWETIVTTNPGAWYDKQAKKVYLLYRAAGSDPEHKIYLGLATSKDGYTFTRASNEPVFPPSVDGFDAGCVEDPRITKMEDYYIILYACRAFPPGQYWITKQENPSYIPLDFPKDFPQAIRNNMTSTGLAFTKDFKHFIRAGRVTDPFLDDRDVILFPEKINGEFYILHRPKQWVGERFGTEHPAIWVTSGKDLMHFDYSKSKLLIKAKYDWEIKLGGNTPPIKTKHGWLTLYHAVGKDNKYRLGAMLLDLNDPTKVLHRTKDWLIQPEEQYELEGYYNGVIFPCGKVIIDDTLFVYYGGADKYVGLATCSVKELLEYLTK